jgi:hypothetical protein
LIEIEQLFTMALNPIQDDLDRDQVKAIVLDTCKSPLEMDIAQMQRSLEKWGFKVEEFELLNEPSPGALKEHMVWLTCNYGIELARTNIENWLTGLKDFPWIGRWDFVVKYARFHRHGPVSDPRGDFTVAVTRFSGGVFNVHGVRAKMPWPDRKREIVDETKWQR